MPPDAIHVELESSTGYVKLYAAITLGLLGPSSTAIYITVFVFGIFSLLAFYRAIMTIFTALA